MNNLVARAVFFFWFSICVTMLCLPHACSPVKNHPAPAEKLSKVFQKSRNYKEEGTLHTSYPTSLSEEKFVFSPVDSPPKQYPSNETLLL